VEVPYRGHPAARSRNQRAQNLPRQQLLNTRSRMRSPAWPISFGRNVAARAARLKKTGFAPNRKSWRVRLWNPRP